MTKSNQHTPQRGATRAPVGQPVRLQFDDSIDIGEGVCENISIGGMFVRAEDVRPQETLVRFELHLSEEQAIRGLGEVIWMRPSQRAGEAPGMGIKFRYLEQQDRQLIFKLVSQHIKERLERRELPGARPAVEPVPTPPADVGVIGGGAVEPAPRESWGATEPETEVDGLGEHTDEVFPDPRASYDSRVTSDPAESLAPEVAPGIEATDTAVGRASALTPQLPLDWSTGEEEEASYSSTSPPLESRHATERSYTETSFADDDEAGRPEAGVATLDERDDLASMSTAGRPKRGRGSRRRQRSPKSPKIVIGVVLLALLAVLGYFLFQTFLGDSETPPPQPVELSPSSSTDEAMGRDQPEAEEPATEAPPTAERTVPSRDSGTSERRPDSTLVEEVDRQTPGEAKSSSPAVSDRVLADLGLREAPAGEEPDPPVSAQPTAPPASPPPPPPPVTSRAFSRVTDITWRRDGASLIVSITLDGRIESGRYDHFRLAGGDPREVVRLRGIDRQWARSVMAVGDPLVSRLRTGFHRRASGNELHVVLDLADPATEIREVRTRGQRLEVVLSR